MLTCERCRDLLWDELFGLLEASDSATLQSHLEGCAGCQAAMHKAEAGQRLLASVARLDIDVPLFTAPAEESIAPAVTNNRAILTLPRRSRRRLWVAAAAAVLVCLGVPYGIYQNGLSQRAQAVEKATRQVEDLQAQAKDLESRAQNELRSFQSANLARHLHLQVLGPATYQPGFLSQYQVVTVGLDGNPRPVELTARVVDTAKEKIVFEKRVSGRGAFNVLLPAGLPLEPGANKARLEFEAAGPGETAHLPADLNVLEAQYITQLATDKRIYHPGETIYFRSLTLQPFDLKPPVRSLNVTYTLRDFQKVTRQRLEGSLQADGSGSGTFTLAADAGPGEYMVGVTQTQQNRFMPVYRTIAVRSSKDGATAQAAPASSPKIELFPEGGSLIAGVPNRIYFRAAAADGSGADVSGWIVDSRGQQVVVVRTGESGERDDSRRGLGAFSFTPAQGESYTLSVTSPPGIPGVALPAALPEGVALTVPGAVVNSGEPVQIVLHAAGTQRQVIVALSCRGSLVAEQALTLQPGATEVTLVPAAGTGGVLRIMVLEAQHEKLQPIAERLIYCLPREALVLGVETDKRAYRPGDRVTLKITNGDEKRQPEQSWLLVSTGKRDALSQASGCLENAPPHLRFASDLAESREKIELAYFFVPNDPQARTALDLFLGTHGWRRSAASSGKGLAGAGNRTGNQDRAAAGFAMFAVDNGAVIEKLCAAEMDAKLKAAQATLNAKIQNLNLKDAHAGLVVARKALTDYDDQALTYVRAALGSGAVMLLLVGSFFLVVAIVGMARSAPSYRRRLAGAFAPLLLCLLTFPVGNWIGTRSTRVPGPLADIGNLIAPKLSIPQLSADMSGSHGARIMTIDYPGVGNRPPVRAGNTPPLPVQAFTFDLAHVPAGSNAAPDTLLWQPVVAAKGRTQVSFDLPRAPGVYRVHVEAHGVSGRLGVAELNIDTTSRGK